MEPLPARGRPSCARPPQLSPGLVLDAFPARSRCVLGDLRWLGARRLQPDDRGFRPPAVTAAFALSSAQAGLLGTVGLVMSAVGGAIAGALADVARAACGC